MSRPTQISTLLLDADGVLQHPPAGWFQYMLTLIGASDWNEVNPVERRHLTGGDPTQTYREAFLRRTASVAEILDAWNDTVVDAVALELVDAVRARGVRCFLASNQQERRARWMRTLPLAEHLDGLFFSCDLGIAKPDPAFFERIVTVIDTDPGKILFIDDSAPNVEGARAAGLRAAHKSWNVGSRGLREILDAHRLL